MKDMRKAYSILKENNMLDRQVTYGYTFEAILNMDEDERPVRRVNDDLVFYTALFEGVDDISEFNRKKYKVIQDEKYNIYKTKDFFGGILIEVPKYVIKNYYTDPKIVKIVSENEVIEIINKDKKEEIIEYDYL